jgi:hypothetical protein
MGYEESIEIEVINRSLKNVIVKNGQVSYGKFHSNGNPDNEITWDNKTIKYEGNLAVCWACGRSFSVYGCTGFFEIWTEDVPTIKVCTFSWSIPFRSKVNSFKVGDDTNENWVVGIIGGNRWGGAVGHVTLKLSWCPLLTRELEIELEIIKELEKSNFEKLKLELGKIKELELAKIKELELANIKELELKLAEIKELELAKNKEYELAQTIIRKRE